LPDLVVSGIVYLDDPEARLAVVNDLPVMLGTTIEGATVVEILSDRVRFRRDGRFFEAGLQL
ncbi:MAG: general secretion pathway protein GspB, partial [Desulfuromonadales bacterium]|nr:general secretion pathway protein GspB [Desulfuromonadales bacterium]